MEDHTHGVRLPQPDEPPPDGYKPAPAPPAPRVEMPEELQPVSTHLPQPTGALPPKPSDEEAGIDNSLVSAAVAAVRRGKPLQKGLNPNS